MTAIEIQRVRDSLGRLSPIGPQAAALFCARWFEFDPSARAGCRGDLTEQSSAWLSELALLVDLLDRADLLRPRLRELGRRAAVRGLQPGQLVTGAEALRWTLDKTLGADFDAPARAAWDALLALGVQALLEGWHQNLSPRPTPSSSTVAA